MPVHSDPAEERWWKSLKDLNDRDFVPVDKDLRGRLLDAFMAKFESSVPTDQVPPDQVARFNRYWVEFATARGDTVRGQVKGWALRGRWDGTETCLLEFARSLADYYCNDDLSDYEP